MAMSISDLKRKLDDLSLEGDYEFTYWDKKVYNHGYVSNADALLVVLPNNAWSIGTEIPEGIRREIVEATSLKKDIYLLYTTRSGINNVYKTLVAHKIGFHMSGLHGCVDKIEPCNRNPVSLNPCSEVKGEIAKSDDSALTFDLYDRLCKYSNNNKGYDNRVLLLLG